VSSDNGSNTKFCENDPPLIGILGGMGTAAGIHFQNLFFQVCNANGIHGDQDYPEWLYFNASKAPDRTEALLGNGPSPEEYLVQRLQKMKAAGVDLVVAVCNTVHSFYTPVYGKVPIPWIDLQDETARKIVHDGYTSVSLMSTEGTLRSGLFRNAIASLQIDYHEPQPASEMQRMITNAIYHPGYGIKYTGAKVHPKALRMLQEVVDGFEVDAIIMGCTELSLAKSHLKSNAVLLDPMEIAAQACYDYCYGKR
jgi:aspartate racemase